MLAIALVAVGLVVVMNWPDGVRDTGCIWPCPGRLNCVARALLDYHDQKHAYPSGTYLNANLPYEDRLSWYADLLPQFDNEAMHKVVLWDQPWNAGFNNKIACTALWSLDCTNQDRVQFGPQLTSYIGIAGLGADAPVLPKSDPRAGVFGYDRMTTVADIKD
jgi:hypothetical protein